MKAIINGHYVSSDEAAISLGDRGLNYGDGIFETMFGLNGHIRFLDYHLERLSSGMSVLDLTMPQIFNKSYILQKYRELARMNHINKRGRIKLMVWRKSGGTYLPAAKEGNFALLVADHKLNQKSRENVVLSDQIHTLFHPLSQFKTMSALTYILGAMEMKKKQGDDIIITDQKGNISECLYSNIFWKMKGTYCTPSLKTGCVDGIMRRKVLELFEDNDIECKEVIEDATAIKQADEIFVTNAGGIYPILKFLDHQFASPVFPKPLRPLLYEGEDRSFQD